MAAAAAAAADRLSGLPDKVLLRILYFAPAKEGASTSILSRRWRSLWLTSGAVNLDSRSYDRAFAHRRRHGLDDVSGKADAFSRGMDAALSSSSSSSSSITRLTLHVDEGCFEVHNSASYRAHNYAPGHDMITVLLAHPASRAAEEVSLVIAPRPGYPAAYYDDDRHTNWSSLTFASLPSETLRSLRADNIASLAAPPPAAAYPRLADLRLVRCGVSVADLQRVVDAAPKLATLHLERYSFGERGGDGRKKSKSGGRLVCPAVTVLVLKDCSWPRFEPHGKVEFDLPRLQHLSYKGSLALVMEHVVFMNNNLSAVVGVDLHLDAESWRSARTPEYFWGLLQGFNAAKVMKLKILPRVRPREQ